MQKVRRLVFVCAGVALGCGVRSSVALAQVVQLADASAPRFLSAPRLDALPVDMRDAPVLQRRVTLNFDRVRLKAALELITRQAGLRFFASSEIVPLDRPVTVHADGITVVAALTELLVGTGLDVQLDARGTAALVPRAGPAETKRQQAGAIAGWVTDAVTRAPLDQVTVRVEGPGLGAVTTRDGRYTIRGVSAGAYHVTARRVGYTPLTTAVTVASDSTTGADFALTAAATKLNEVVTTAVGEQRRYEVGNTISTINADSIAPTAPITSLTDLISARAPGVDVEETGGLTGSGEAIRIRGLSSLVLQGDPIVIVDGVRQDNTAGGTATLPLAASIGPVTPSPSRLNDLNFADIESIDVLKGPAASTEYGTDAANGVIVITTKHGTAGRPQWHASGEETASTIPVSFPAHYYSWGHTTDASHTAVTCPLFSVFLGPSGSVNGTCAVDSVTTWDPLNHSFYSVFGSGSRQKYDLSVGGGSAAVRYFVAAGLSNETGIVRLPPVFIPQADALGLPHSVFNPNGESQRSVRTNTAIQLGPTTDLTATGAYMSSYQKTPNAQYLYAGINQTPPIPDSANAYGYGNFPFITPVFQFGLPTSQASQRLTGGVTANWRPQSWLVGHGTVGVDHGSLRSDAAILPEIAAFGQFVPAQLAIETATTDIYTVDLRGSATVALTQVIRAVTSVGLQLADARTQGTIVTATGITATNFTLNGAVNPTVAQLGNRQATLGGYGEEQLGFADRLFLTAALRIDGASGFGKDYSTAVYPKASVSWLALSTGPATVRFRGAFGESGVQPPNGSALQLYAATTDWLNGGQASTVAIANVQNQRLRPELSEEYEGGVDLGLRQNRVSVEVTGYSKTTRDALVSTGTGWEAGGFAYEQNVGTVRNSGVEGTVTAAVVQTRPLMWEVSVNASANRNKLITLGPGVQSQQLMGAYAAYRFRAGFPLYGYWAPMVQYTDLNHDGVIEPSEVTVANSLSYVGPSSPTREASLGSRVGLLNGAVSINALLDYRGGFRLLYTDGYLSSELQKDLASNDRTAPLWEQARAVAAQAVFKGGLNNYVPPTGWYEDATYLRFRELSLTYSLPRGLIRALRVQSLSFTGAVRNLALWTKYDGVDPEVAGSFGINGQLSPTSNTTIVNNNMREQINPVPLLRYEVIRLNVGL